MVSVTDIAMVNVQTAPARSTNCAKVVKRRSVIEFGSMTQIIGSARCLRGRFPNLAIASGGACSWHHPAITHCIRRESLR